MAQIHEMTAVELVAQYRRKTLSPITVMKHTFERLSALDPHHRHIRGVTAIVVTAIVLSRSMDCEATATGTEFRRTCGVMSESGVSSKIFSQ